jgi:excisionase family DNA binding protein
MSRPVVPPPDLASVLRALADRVDTLDPAQIVGELEALKFQVWTAATMSNGLRPPGPPGPSRALDITAVQERLGVSKGKIYRLARNGELPFAHRIGRRIVFDEAGLGRWLERRAGQRRW